jgi:predicted HTH domain antitoxin
MKTLTFDIPEDVDENEVKLSVAYVLFDKGSMSSGEAAQFADVSKRWFLENAAKYGTSIFGESVEDLNSNDWIE